MYSVSLTYLKKFQKLLDFYIVSSLMYSFTYYIYYTSIIQRKKYNFNMLFTKLFRILEHNSIRTGSRCFLPCTAKIFTDASFIKKQSAAKTVFTVS